MKIAILLLSISSLCIGTTVAMERERGSEYIKEFEKYKDNPTMRDSFIAYVISSSAKNPDAVRKFYVDLKARGIDLATETIIDLNKNNQLHRAVLSGNPEIVGFIGGLNPTLLEKKNSFNQTPLELAIAHRNQEVINELLDLEEAYKASKASK
jgi:ankyrin repeat protein